MLLLTWSGQTKSRNEMSKRASTPPHGPRDKRRPRNVECVVGDEKVRGRFE